MFVKCFYCKNHFLSSKAFFYHFKLDHKVGADLRCGQKNCFRIFSTLKSFRRHIHQHFQVKSIKIIEHNKSLTSNGEQESNQGLSENDILNNSNPINNDGFELASKTNLTNLNLSETSEEYSNQIKLLQKCTTIQ